MKGEVRKLKFEPRIMDSQLVKEGLIASSVLLNSEPYYLVGGMATQSYLPSSCRRPTSDIDFSVVRPLNYSDFKIMTKPVIEYLKDNGYEADTVKRSRSYCIDAYDSKTKEAICLEFSRRNKKNFDKNKKRLARELENSNLKIIEERENLYRVCSTEDIIVPKVVRSVGSVRRNPNFLSNLDKEKNALSQKRINKKIKDINSLRSEAMISPSDLELAEKLRFISDVYDIRILFEIAGINEKYLGEASNDWNLNFKEDSLESRVIQKLLPLGI